MADVTCPKCGEQERLQGTTLQTFIHVRCEACGHGWQRELRPKCAVCGSADLEFTPIPLWSAGRGTMRTPAGQRDAWSCRKCGAADATRREDRGDP